jgi:hypothetical protein
MFESAEGAFHTSLGRSPRILSPNEKGLKARSINGIEIAAATGAYLLFGTDAVP